MNQNNKLNLLKLSIIRRVLESRSKSNNSNNNKTMAWRATGENNDTFVDELKGKNNFLYKRLPGCIDKIFFFRIWSY